MRGLVVAVHQVELPKRPDDRPLVRQDDPVEARLEEGPAEAVGRAERFLVDAVLEQAAVRALPYQRAREHSRIIGSTCGIIAGHSWRWHGTGRCTCTAS